jgi:hypothetical protein
MSEVSKSRRRFPGVQNGPYWTWINQARLRNQQERSQKHFECGLKVPELENGFSTRPAVSNGVQASTVAEPPTRRLVRRDLIINNSPCSPPNSKAIERRAGLYMTSLGSPGKLRLGLWLVFGPDVVEFDFDGVA